MLGIRRSDDAVSAASSGALAVLPGWAFSGPFAWGAGTGVDAAVGDADLLIQEDDGPADQSGPDSLPYLSRAAAPETASDQLTIAAEVLWQQLRASRFQWQRSVAVGGRVLSFYSAPARVAVEIVDAGGDADPNLSSPTESGIRMVPVPLPDIEQRCGTVVGWLDTVCVGRTLAGVSAANSVIPDTGTRWRRRRPR
jgi:hypothetical protein